ncbi:MAG: alkaline phosphatase D family protein [Sulfurimonas sp.]
MQSKISLGPILGIEKEMTYTVCVVTEKSVASVNLLIDGVSVPALKSGNPVSGIFWRAEYTLSDIFLSRYVEYSLELDNIIAYDKNKRKSWRFYIPSAVDVPKFAYTSCNGFSNEGLKESSSNPYYLWSEMVQIHEKTPFSALLMGGDQLYADSIWGDVKKLSEWSNLPREEKIKKKVTKEMERQIDKFYARLYQDRWSTPDMSLMLASIPSVMMWDDHDIFDGWGSYPKDIQECDVYQCIFKYAKKYFELYQMRTRKNSNLLNTESSHYALSLSFRGYQIIAIDNRSERTLEQIMSATQWKDFLHHLDVIDDKRDVLLMSGVPVVYRDFSFTEGIYDYTSWEEELTDDLKDHWRAKEHQGERLKLIMNLLNSAKKRVHRRTVILSGDVHVGSLGIINDTRSADIPLKIHQVVSSGIVHPPPSILEWYGILAITNDRNEYLNENDTIKTSMLQPHSSNKYIRSRNFVTIEEGTDNKLWINWICENKDKPVYPLER